MAKIYRQTSTLGRLVDEGKRDPEWVSEVLQAAIEHREDGRIDFVRDTTVIALGKFEVDYETPIAELAEGLETINPKFGLFETQPKPMNYQGGCRQVELSLVRYSFNCQAPLCDDVRSLLIRERLLPVQIRELIAVVKKHPDMFKDLSGWTSIIALGCGIPVSGTIGSTPCMFEQVPMARRFSSGESWDLCTKTVTHGWVDEGDHFLVRQILSDPKGSD